MRKKSIVAGMGIIAVAMASVALAQSGADTYKAKCAMCHAADGSGSTPAGKSMKAIPFKDPELVKASAATKNGKGKMPAYAGKLTDAQITEVVGYIRTLQK